MADGRYCRRERREFALDKFSLGTDGRYIHEIPGDRHYTDGDQWYPPGDRRGHVESPDLEAPRDSDPDQ